MMATDDTKVVIQNPAGEYLAGDNKSLWFTDDRFKAIIFDYKAHRVEAQLAMLQQEGIVLKAVPVPLKEFYETCDRCEKMLLPLRAFFDGRQFLCPDCRAVV